MFVKKVPSPSVGFVIVSLVSRIKKAPGRDVHSLITRFIMNLADKARNDRAGTLGDPYACNDVCKWFDGAARIYISLHVCGLSWRACIKQFGASLHHGNRFVAFWLIRRKTNPYTSFFGTHPKIRPPVHARATCTMINIDSKSMTNEYQRNGRNETSQLQVYI